MATMGTQVISGSPGTLPQWATMPRQVFIGLTTAARALLPETPGRMVPSPSHQEKEMNLPRKPRTYEQSTLTGLSPPQMDGWRLSHPDLLRWQSLLPQMCTHVTESFPGTQCGPSHPHVRDLPSGLALSLAPDTLPSWSLSELIRGTWALDLHQRISWWKRW